MNVIKTAFQILKLTEGTTGGHTRCRHCSCLVKNEDFECRATSNAKCPSCNHLYRDHDQYL